jgi:segregation and condensation protein A
MTLLTPFGTTYRIQTEVYEGPLDLLLDLINKAELDITRLSLAKVTDQYLAHLQGLQETKAVEVSEFLVIAAKLIQIKSEALLPRPPHREEGEEDPGESLARQLRIYKAIKESTRWLESRVEDGLRTYIRLAPPPVIEDELDLEGKTVDDLVELLKDVFRFEEDAAPITSVVAIPKITIKNKIWDVLTTLRNDQALSYRNFLSGSKNRLDAIVLFLAILELIKQQYVTAQQDMLFKDINIFATEKTLDNSLETGEITLALDD